MIVAVMRRLCEPDRFDAQENSLPACSIPAAKCAARPGIVVSGGSAESARAAAFDMSVCYHGPRAGRRPLSLFRRSRHGAPSDVGRRRRLTPEPATVGARILAALGAEGFSSTSRAARRERAALIAALEKAVSPARRSTCSATSRVPAALARMEATCFRRTSAHRPGFAGTCAQAAQRIWRFFRGSRCAVLARSEGRSMKKVSPWSQAERRGSAGAGGGEACGASATAGKRASSPTT
jgi:hypothetical protein